MSDRDGGSLRRYLPTVLLMPTIGASLGVDGGPIFQILAVEDLGLSAAAIGVAFGLGVVSLPIQLYAARLPIERARANLRLFLVLAALQAWVLAVLVGLEVTGGIAAIALGITVVAEISVSTLFATSWQPLVADGLDSIARQRLSSQWAALARAVLAGAVLVFAALDHVGRAAFLVAVGVFATATAIGLRSIRSPERVEEAIDDRGPGTRLATGTRLVLVVLGVANFVAFPLWLVYLDVVLWPEVNLGAIAATQTAAGIVALLAWRSTDGDVTGRAVAASIATLGAALAMLVVRDPAGSTSDVAIVFAASAVGAFGVTIIRVAMLESAHRTIKPENSVRAFTLLDVVASTSLQVGLVVAGFLIGASTDTSGLADPYLVVLVGGTAATIPAVVALRRQTRRLVV